MPINLDFRCRLKENAEGHERLRAFNSEAKSEKSVKPKTTEVFAANFKVSLEVA